MTFKIAPLLLTASFLLSCTTKPGKDDQSSLPIQSTWRLISGTTTSKGEHTFTDYTKTQQMIKIINGSHFAFFKHDLKPGKDGKNNFDAGGGSYQLKGDQYTEHLDYYNDRNWEGKAFTFTVKINGDTLVQKGIEKVEGTGVDREITEKYIKVK
jgi:hypothetical protein